MMMMCRKGHSSAVNEMIAAIQKKKEGLPQPAQKPESRLGSALRSALEKATQSALSCGPCIKYLRQLKEDSTHEDILMHLSDNFPFPDEWEIEGTILNQYKQIGNAVPIGLGEALGKAILNNLQGKKTIDKYRNFQYSRYKNTDDLSWKASYRESVRKAKFDLMQLAFPN
jgi:hypothetical protein